MDLARSIQDVTEEVLMKMADHVQAVTQMTNLCLAGGVALNCVGNGKILREGKFKNIWIQPAAGDAGGALGVAMFIWYGLLNKERVSDDIHDQQDGSYLGPQYTDDEIERCLNDMGACYERVTRDEYPAKVAGLISQQKVIGLLDGCMEFGPRALGSRSIIADARSQKMQSIINLKIKFRESFRPFAPSVLEEQAQKFFDLSCPSPYMLLVAPVHQGQIHQTSYNQNAGDILGRLSIRRSTIPAVTHVDYSARIQTVCEETNPRYYQIIHEFYKQTGCPVIINTSFNIRGEPIVCTPEEAYRCFMCTDMDYLVIGNYICDKTEQPHRERYRKEDISQILD
jgi:carbamoyltransferase